MDKFWTIPNILSITRIVLIIPIINQLRNNTPESNLISFFLISFAYLTDFLDGFFARKLNMGSSIGKILDPVGDKLLAITVSAVLYINKKLPFYFFILILIRDLIISLGAMYAINVKGRILLPIFAGKLTTAVLGIVLSIYPLRYAEIFRDDGVLINILEVLRYYGTLISSLLLFISGILYAFYYFENFLNRKRLN